MEMKIKIRSETEEDYQQITNVITSAFGQTNEGTLVTKLRKTACFNSQLSLVALVESKIVGYVLFYPIKIDTGVLKCISLSLAPIAVNPDYQRKGIGSKLIRVGLKAAKKLGFRSIIVIGHSEYYPRFGFEVAKKWGLSAPFAVPEDVFFAKELVEKGLDNCRGTIEYPQEFYECM